MDIIPQTPYERLAPLRNDYNKRFSTFDHRWPNDVPVTREALAQDGFYYTGLEDKVQCTHCGGILSGWCEGDVVAVEHRQHFPNCPWVRQRGYLPDSHAPTSRPSNAADLSSFSVSETVPSGEQFDFRYVAAPDPNDIPGVTRPKFHNYAMESARKASFKGWPNQITQRPEVLSKAGFFYLGKLVLYSACLKTFYSYKKSGTQSLWNLFEATFKMQKKKIPNEDGLNSW